MMEWYIEKKTELDEKAQVLSVCGDDCAVCPRYIARTETELHETAEFWYKAGWRDHVVSNDEIRCNGCGSRKSCSFNLLPCAEAHGVTVCCDCPEFECDRIKAMYISSASKKEGCRVACGSKEEFDLFVRAFYEKERNLRGRPETDPPLSK